MKLAGLAMALFIAGCVGSAPGGSEDLVDRGGFALDEDQYYTTGAEIYSTATLRITVNSDRPIEVFVLDPTNLQQYEGGHSFRPISGCSGLASSNFHSSCVVAKGTIHVVFDNTDKGSYAPPFDGINDVATVDYTMRIT